MANADPARSRSGLRDGQAHAPNESLSKVDLGGNTRTLAALAPVFIDTDAPAPYQFALTAG